MNLLKYRYCFSNAYMVYLMIVQQSRNAERVMVFDVKQFKSLEGFLESGPQFVLQAYILLRNPLEEGMFDFYTTCDIIRVRKISIDFSLAYDIHKSFYFRSNRDSGVQHNIVPRITYQNKCKCQSP